MEERKKPARPSCRARPAVDEHVEEVLLVHDGEVILVLDGGRRVVQLHLGDILLQLGVSPASAG